MELRPTGYDKVVQLVNKGVIIPNPLTLDVGEEVDVARISGEGVTIYPGCRLYGAKTVISAGVKLGAEAPVTLDDCRLGSGVELAGGYFRRSVFLGKAKMGSGAHVREGCLVEEEASGAHCVGLKQTILFPFVTLGSLINFCDCFMAGGTSRQDHSEVGSSYIHFNYTPDGDKATASLFGDVPRGVMLACPPIFLGGQGAAVGPVQVGYGTVVASGSVLRHDVWEDGQLVASAPPPGFRRKHHPRAYPNLVHIVRNNVIYLANLVALEEWYRRVRRLFFARQEMGELLYEGALEVLASARAERTKRLMDMAEKVPATKPSGREFRERAGEVCALFAGAGPTPSTSRSVPPLAPEGVKFLEALESAASVSAGTSNDVSAGYLQTIQGLPQEVSAQGTRWLQGIVDGLCQQADSLLPAMSLFMARG
jgi:bifunctional UDP-N-acetylglucosamine pyrophosphorylase/glucosamine-1-phosphate N-acetyltransferase